MTTTRTRSVRSDGQAGAEATREFFEGLAERPEDLLVSRLSGSIRFDLAAEGGVTHWYVELDRGRVTVSHRRGPADGVLAMDAGLFDDIVLGRANALAAVLRGAVAAEGDLGLIMSFQRLFGARAAGRQAAIERPAHDGPASRRHGRER